MIVIACSIAAVAICIAMAMTLWRLTFGPDSADRILALDTLVVNVIGLVVLAGILYGTAMYFEAALLLAMVGFVTTVAFCKFLLRGNVIE